MMFDPMILIHLPFWDGIVCIHQLNGDWPRFDPFSLNFSSVYQLSDLWLTNHWIRKAPEGNHLMGTLCLPLDQKIC